MQNIVYTGVLLGLTYEKYISDNGNEADFIFEDEHLMFDLMKLFSSVDLNICNRSDPDSDELVFTVEVPNESVFDAMMSIWVEFVKANNIQIEEEY